jgi:uncharacterized protein (DUF305 family)
MTRFWFSGAGLNWRAAALLGLISSTFSTLVSQFTAARIGRDAVVDWMVVAAIPLRDPALQVEPSWPVILAGILFHQWADFSWAVVFFGLLGRWTAALGPWTLLLISPFWALFTSSLEWLFLVPVLPFWQPIFTLEQPYWIGFLVHLSSASMYPLFPWLRDWMAGREPLQHQRFTTVWSGLALLGVLGLGALAVFGGIGRELPWMGRDAAFDQSYMRRMSAHHEQGIVLARLAAERASNPHLRALARLMAAAQQGENAIFAQWWQSWFPSLSQVCSPAEEAGMPGMLRPDQIEQLRIAEGAPFDALFVNLMTQHHRGAIDMAIEAIGKSGDFRLKLMSHAIRHEQRGEIALMQGSRGVPAVKSAIENLLLPANATGGDSEQFR